MRRTRADHAGFWLAFVAFLSMLGASRSPTLAGEAPRLMILSGTELHETKQRLDNSDPALLAAFNRLKREADRALLAGPFSVTHKEFAPPSGNKHDYVSLAPYWWPDPATANGLPYVRRDGEVNPQRDQRSDRKRFANLMQSTATLALGYFFTGREAYAQHAAKLLRGWFIDDGTKMNPHLRFAQAVPGRNQGRGAGIIETHNLPDVIDAVGLLKSAKSWTAADQKSLQGWFNDYLNWLLESPEGQAEARARNNHGSWYDVQVASFALFVGRDELARRTMSEFAAKRIAAQIEADGRQPQELARTEAWSYSLFNLEGFFSAAAIGEKVGIDLWRHDATDKPRLRKAIDWLIPFALGEKKWPYQQISGLQPERIAPLLRRAAIVYGAPDYEKAIAKLRGIRDDERWRLLYPKNATADLDHVQTAGE